MPEPSSTSSDPSAFEDPAGRAFPIVRRGFDQDAVRAHLVDAASLIRKLRANADELDTKLADAEARAASPVLDEETLTAAVGAETAKILRSANEAARDVLGRAETKAAELHAEAGSVLAERTRAAEAETRVIVGRARAEATALVEATKAECRTMVEEARDARRRILADLADRRRLLHLQLEQLRAGKDSLAEVVDATARSVEHIVARLGGAEVEARAAADRAAELTSFEDETSLEALVEESFVLAVSANTAEGETTAAADEGSVDPPSLSDATTSNDDPRIEMDGSIEPIESVSAEVADVVVTEIEIIEVEVVEIEVTEGADPESDIAIDHLDNEVAEGESPAGGASGGEDRIAGAVNPEEDTGSDVEPASAAPEVAGPSVDDLFARIRAGRAAPEGPSAARSSADAGPTANNPTVSSTRGAARADATASHSGLATAVIDDFDVDALDVTDDGLQLDGDEAALLAREEVLAPIVLDLSRTLKRELRSDQNVLLDALRGLQRGAAASGLVPGEETKARLATATSPMIAAAWRAGKEFAGAVPSGSMVPGPEVAQAASELAEEVVSSLRSRLELVLTAVEDDGTTAELVGAAYRQWRGERVDDLAGHYSAMVFSIGVIDGVAASTLVRWVVDDGADPCPDCDDNALAGPQSVGEPFPTGQLNPPVHPGCRCMLVPTDA